jgi:hypothetical protein
MRLFCYFVSTFILLFCFIISFIFVLKKLLRELRSLAYRKKRQAKYKHKQDLQVPFLIWSHTLEAPNNKLQKRRVTEKDEAKNGIP